MTESDLERSTMKRVYWHVVPLLFMAMLFNYIDRINIGYAALHMNHDLGLTPAMFGTGASIFFLGYMLFEVPSNMMLSRVGARLWIARILLTWGLLATALAFISGPGGFYSLRFLLGVAEAGFLPGLCFFTAAWFPHRYRTRAVGGYVVAGQFASVVAGPVSTMIMTYCDGLFSLHGWQWMLMLEGVPTIILGVLTLRVLTDRPADAKWLSVDQREWLVGQMQTERDAIEGGQPFKLFDALRDGRVWSLAAVFALALVGIDGLHFWQPQIIKAFGSLSDIEVGLLSALPAILSAAGTIAVSISADRTGDRKIHLGLLYVLSAIGFAAFAYTRDPAYGYILLCIAAFGINSGNSLFWSLNSSLMTGAAAAVSIAFVNTVAQAGGLVGPWMIGQIRENGGSFQTVLLALAGFTAMAAIIAFSLRIKARLPGSAAPVMVKRSVA